MKTKQVISLFLTIYIFFLFAQFCSKSAPYHKQEKKNVYSQKRKTKNNHKKKGALIRNTTTHAYLAPACKLKKRANEKLKFTAFKNGLLLSKTQRGCASDYVSFAQRNGKKRCWVYLALKPRFFFFDCLFAYFICFFSFCAYMCLLSNEKK